MGANTIRRYSPSIYDYNILNVAEEQGLKVLYGFWFDPQVDFYADLAEIENYKEEVINRVNRFKHHPAVLAWCIGNETWGILKQYNEEDYTEKVRRAYLSMLEDLAKEIHRLDPSRPVFSMLEHSPDLDRSLTAINRFAPSIDAIGVNSYYRSRISHLNAVIAKYSPNKPYLVSEFGPKGYWDPELSSLGRYSRAWEESDLEKAQDYYDQWKYFIKPNQGKNLGGVAFCWRDRMEGSLTWFGLTDFRNKKKLSYHVLRKAWTSKYNWDHWPDVRLSVRAYDDYKFEARVIIPQKLADKYSFKWSVVRDDYLEEVGTVKTFADDERGAVFTLPMAPNSETKYRIYLHMYDGLGNVITASQPVNPLQ